MENQHPEMMIEEKLQGTHLIQNIVAEFVQYKGEKNEAYFNQIRKRISDAVRSYEAALKTIADSEKDSRINQYLVDIGYLSSTSIFTPSDVNQFMGQLNSKRIE